MVQSYPRPEGVDLTEFTSSAIQRIFDSTVAAHDAAASLISEARARNFAKSKLSRTGSAPHQAIRLIPIVLVRKRVDGAA